MSESARLRKRFAEQKRRGMLDIKFALAENLDGVTAEDVCGEVNRLYDAMDRGDFKPLDFKDRTGMKPRP